MHDFYFFMLFIHSCSSLALSAVVINTWQFKEANKKAWQSLQENRTALESVVNGCHVCEERYHICDQSVGYGGSPDENGETALDAMVFDGKTHDVGAVANLRKVKSAIEVAYAVMKYTKETFLVGDLATEFAIQMGFKSEPLNTSDSTKMWEEWKHRNCQPNFWQNVLPDPSNKCGPYRPTLATASKYSTRYNTHVDIEHHDTIGMVALDHFGDMAVGTSTNGATFKIPGRVGDSPIAGAGGYVDNDIGGAAATGDGDVMMRFLPSFEVVRMMESGVHPSTATQRALLKIAKYYPQFSGALVALTKNGTYGAACYGFPTFQFSLATEDIDSKVFNINCSNTGQK